MKRILLFAIVLLCPLARAGEVVIPAVFRGPGAVDTVWRTELVVSNISTDPAAFVVPISVNYHGSDGTLRQIRLSLTGMEVYAIEDVVRDWFDVEYGGGLVRITWDDSTSNARIIARARIYNDGAYGEYGQSVPGIESSKLLTDQFLPGLTGIDGNRTNVGIANPSLNSALVWVELIDTAGNSRGSFSTVVEPRSYRQFNDIFSGFQAGPLQAAMVRIKSPDVAVYAYASIVRNDTGDATFVVGQ
jgi:hypothetical protein